MDYLIYFVIAAAYIFLLVAIFVTNRKITVKGQLPGRYPGIGLFAAFLLYFIFFRIEAGDERRIYLLLLLGVGLLFLPVKAGISEDGIYAYGWLTPYDKLSYFAFEQGYGNYARLRTMTKSREYVLHFKPDQQELITAHFIAAGVPDFEQYKAGYRARTAEKREKREQKRRGK